MNIAKRLVKRADGTKVETEHYYLRVMINGRQHSRCLETADKQVAKANAKLFIEQTKRDIFRQSVGLEPAVLASKRGLATLADIADAYNKALEPSAATRKHNLTTLFRIVAVGEDIARHKVSEQPASVLTRELVLAWQNKMIAEAKATDGDEDDEAEPDKETEGRARRSLNWMLTQARSVFAQSQMDRGVYAGLKLPDLRGFLAAPRVTQTELEPFEAMTQKEVATLETAAARLKLADPAAYIAFRLMAHGGLRNSEVAHMQREWLRKDEDGHWRVWIVVYPYFKPKATLRAVGFPAVLAEEILAMAGPKWIVPGETKTERHDVTHRRLNDWIASVLPDRRAYDLRKQAGSIIARSNGILAAARFLGHQDVSTTTKWYAGVIDRQPEIEKLVGRV
jgi:integrase